MVVKVRRNRKNCVHVNMRNQEINSDAWTYAKCRLSYMPYYCVGVSCGKYKEKQ